MSDPAKKLQLVDADEIFEYPIPKGERLDSHHFIAWKFDWWLHSEFRLRAEKDVRAIGFDLFCIAQKENPVGTLPQDELILARLTGESLEEWRRLMDRPITPLHNWKPCKCSNGEVRLYHETVLNVAEDALSLKKKHYAANARSRERKRLHDLKLMIERIGAKQLLGNEGYLEALDAWITKHMPDRYRTEPTIRRAIEEMSMEASS